MSTITPQYQAYDGAPLTYTAVSSSDSIYGLTSTTVLHIFNAGETNDVVIFYSPPVLEEGQTGTPCTAIQVEAGGEVIIGPFDYDAYAPSLTVTHSTTTDVYIAAFFSEPILVEKETVIATEAFFFDPIVSETAPAIATEAFFFDPIVSETAAAIATEVAVAEHVPNYAYPEITPQYLAYDSAPLTYAAVSSNDLIYPLTNTTVLHIFNASEIDDLISFYPSPVLDEGPPETQSTVSVEAGGEVIIGPFDYDAYAPSLTVTHTHIADVYIAAFFSEPILVKTEIAIATEVAVAAWNPDYRYPIEAAELTTVNGVLRIPLTILAGVLPSATVEIGE